MDLNRISRRDALRTAGTGLGLLAIPTLLQAENQLAPKASQFPAKAKHIIHVYLNGGPSQVDTWDPKPELNKRDGQRLPIRNLTTERETGVALGSPFKFKQYGHSTKQRTNMLIKFASFVRCTPTHPTTNKVCG